LPERLTQHRKKLKKKLAIFKASAVEKQNKIMEDDANRFVTLFERAADYGKTSLELAKLQAVKETSDVVSTWVPHTIVLVFISTCIMLFSLGLALWIGGEIGNIYYGFFIVAASYGVIALALHFIFHKWIKKHIRQCLIKKILN
jgi:hypothetical protein